MDNEAIKQRQKMTQDYGPGLAGECDSEFSDCD